MGIISSAIRAFVISLFVVVGLTVGFMILGAMIGTQDEIDTKTTVKILPNAKGERKTLGSTGPVILQLNLDGVIGADGLTADKINTILTESREGSLKDNRVKAILLHINSPGGVAFDSQSIYFALKTYKERYKVPIIAYIDGLGASGGYMAALAADKIVSVQGSIIGSVGVVMPTVFNVSDVLQKYDVKTLTLSAGKDKDMLNPFRPWKEDEAADIKTIIDNDYKAFVDMVVQNRPHIDKQKLVDVYGAKVWSADTALEYGYIDATDVSLSKAIEMTLQAAKITDEDYRVVELSSKAWLSDLVESRFPLLQGKIVHQLQLHPDIAPELMNKPLYLFLPAGA